MFRRPPLSLLVLVSVGLLSTSACRPETPPAEAPQTTAGMAERQLTAGDTFGVLRAIHGAEADFARLAERKATDPHVRAFAEKVVSAHQSRTPDERQLIG